MLPVLRKRYSIVVSGTTNMTQWYSETISDLVFPLRFLSVLEEAADMVEIIKFR